jgi:FkbM family methyltransferase
MVSEKLMLPEEVAPGKGEASERPLPLMLRVLLSLSRRLPPIPRISGISNRFLKPLWCSRHSGPYVFQVWPGIRMLLDPGDAVGGNLAFIPQLYDRWERAAIRDLLPEGGTFVDVGANVGAYSLWAARVVGERGRVIAYEAEPRNYDVLKTNLELNRVKNATAFNVGVSDQAEQLTLYLNASKNSGGNTFVPGIHPPGPGTITVPCRPLLGLLRESGAARVDFMKLDIEGFESRVLARFFAESPEDSLLRPRYVLTELSFGRGDTDLLIPKMLEHGYHCVTHRNGNALFQRKNP